MNALFNYIRSDKIILFCFLASGVCIILGFLLLAFSLPKLPDLVPLYNQLPWGQARLGKKAELFIPFSLSVTICAANLWLSKYFYQKLPVVARFLAATGFIASLLILAFIARTIELVS